LEREFGQNQNVENVLIFLRRDGFAVATVLRAAGSTELELKSN
jgi:hypothetical protein